MDKRRIVLELVKLGMDFNTAAMTAECNFDEIEILQADETFQRDVAASQAILERDLLKHINKIVDMNAACGNSTEIRWMLERINPRRWGSTSKVNLGNANNAPLIIKYDDGDK